MTMALEIKGLTKEYPGFRLDGLDLELPKGCILGLIGENGAGKSTTAKATKPLGEPLPDGIVPDFAYHALVDMTTRAGFTMRQIHLDLPDLDAETAAQRLVAQFQAAGYEASEPTWHEGTLIQSVYSPVEGGARGITVVEYGGAHVAITARDYEADHSRRAEGYQAVLRLQVNTRAEPSRARSRRASRHRAEGAASIGENPTRPSR